MKKISIKIKRNFRLIREYLQLILYCKGFFSFQYNYNCKGVCAFMTKINFM
jgi:hypothetical protein